MAAKPDQPRDDDKTETPELVEQPDFGDEDEAAMDRVWDRLNAGESLDEVAEEDEEEEGEDEENEDDES